ncbi:MAG TPA: 2'-5' RNA ligase family protein [Candidatus Saccharimonadales bacterium]|nr:2'-5' RNA ligase family protein [Candidatus Saccharimonadales bacterium]
MQFTQKYTIIQLFEAVPEGTQFSWKNWPLHATVVDVFAIDWDVETMITHLQTLLASHATATAVAQDDAFFGPEKQTRVVLLQKTDSLAALHADLVAMLTAGGLQMNNPQFAGDGFVPHSTVQRHGRLHKGDEVSFAAITLIDMFPDQDPYQRKVIKTIAIGA